MSTTANGAKLACAASAKGEGGGRTKRYEEKRKRGDWGGEKGREHLQQRLLSHYPIKMKPN